MKIHLLVFIVSSISLILFSGYKKSQAFNTSQVFNDSIRTITLKAKFIKKSTDEYCGYVHLPERNMFEIISFKPGVPRKKIIEVEYYTGCLGSHFIQGQTYFITANKCPDRAFYQNIKTTSIRHTLISE